MAFKMKGSPMYRNYGVGTPHKKTNGDSRPEKMEKMTAIQATGDIDRAYFRGYNTPERNDPPPTAGGEKPYSTPKPPNFHGQFRK